MELEKVRSWLEEMNLKFEEGKDILVIPYESTLIAVREVQWREGRSIVEIVATVAVDVKESLELFKFLMAKNAEIPFGKFVYVENGVDALPTIYFAHSLLAEKLDKEEFEAALTTVMGFSDEYDEKVAELGGGKTYREYVRERAGGVR